MKLSELLEGLKWTGPQELCDVLANEWTESQRCLPETLPFALPGSLDDACQALELPEEARGELVATAKTVSSNPHLSALSWHLHYCAFQSATYPSWDLVGEWPSVELLNEVLDGDGRTFYLLILASGFPVMKTIYDSRGIADDILSDTLDQLKDELSGLHESAAVWGVLGPDRVQWHRFTLRGEIFRLDRLSFQFGLFRWAVRVFRHRTSNAVVALSEGGVSYLPTGQINGPGREDTSGEWISELVETDDGVTGNPVLPTGRALPRSIHLPHGEWRQILARDDPALYFHIPGGSPLAPDACRASFEQAAEFFTTSFPDRPYVCFCCDSWVLNSQLQELLPPTSNMVRFQRELYLLPHITYDTQLADMILGGIPEDLDKAPRDTALKRSLVDFLAEGGRLHASAGSGFLLAEDFRWGEQVYIRQRLPWVDGEDPHAPSRIPRS